MKPIVIYVDKGKSLTFTKKEFEQYLEQAYNQGYADGYNSKQGATPVIMPYISKTGDNPLNPPYIWTCDDSKAFYNDYNTITTVLGDFSVSSDGLCSK